MPIDPHMKNPRKKGIWYRTVHHRGWGFPDILTVRGSVFPTIFPNVFFTTLIGVVVCIIYIEHDINIAVPFELAGSVAVVVGLLLAFRTNNAYEKFSEGRRLFTSMCTQVRNCARVTWVGVSETSEQDHLDKEDNIKLLLAYVVAVKHHLRLEFGTNWSDLADLLPPGLQITPFDGNADQEQQRELGNEPTTVAEDLITNPVTTIHRGLAGLGRSSYNLLRSSVANGDVTIYFDEQEWEGHVDASMSLPLEIVMYLGLYYDQKHRDGHLDAGRFGAISGNLNALIEILGNLERIANTPMPHAYNVHLKQAVTLYTWALPFGLVARIGWATIPCIFLVAFILFGVEAIGAEIENPFGYDRNDLPLDEYCKDLEAEVKYLQRHIPPGKPPTDGQ